MPDDIIEARARRAAEEIVEAIPFDFIAEEVDYMFAIIMREMEGTTTFSTKARTKLERTLRDFKERLECIPEHYGRKRKENYKDWLKQEIKEIEGILKEGAP